MRSPLQTPVVDGDKCFSRLARSSLVWYPGCMLAIDVRVSRGNLHFLIHKNGLIVEGV